MKVGFLPVLCKSATYKPNSVQCGLTMTDQNRRRELFVRCYDKVETTGNNYVSELIFRKGKMCKQLFWEMRCELPRLQHLKAEEADKLFRKEKKKKFIQRGQKVPFLSITSICQISVQHEDLIHWAGCCCFQCSHVCR